MSHSSAKTYCCKYCGQTELKWSWDFRYKKPLLQDSNGYPHSLSCSSLKKEDNDIKPAKCKYCKAEELFWVKRGSRFELTESYGLQHVCDKYTEIYHAHKEAIRMNYAFEKAWVNRFPDDTRCKRCDARGYKTYSRGKNRRPKARTCKWCKGVGTFTAFMKKNYLKCLRKKYWPWNGYGNWR